MSTTIDAPQIALARVDGLLNKVYVSGLILLMLDLTQNAFRQVQYLNAIWFWVTFGALMTTVIGAAFAAFKFGHARYWYRAMVLTLVVVMLTWGFQMSDAAALPADFKPWVWWAVGPVTIAVVGGWGKRWSYIGLAVIPILWLVVETSKQGGAVPIGLAIQDSLYTFFFSTALAVMAMALRDRASELDYQNGLALNAAVARTRAEVLGRERAVFNSILHDKVLTTLELAANATSEKLRRQAAAAAADAKGRLEREIERRFNPPENVSLSTITEPFIEGVQRVAPEFKITSTGNSDLEIPFQVAASIYEATLLATANSMTHAPRASERQVRLRLTKRGIKVVVSDNGSGFRMSNVHKTALGLRWTMFKRLESYGVKASLESKPGSGTTWIFEWYP